MGKGFKCPLSAGAAELDLDLTLSQSIPAKLARVTIELTAQSSNGDKALCVQIKTAPENLMHDGENFVAATNASSIYPHPYYCGSQDGTPGQECGSSTCTGPYTGSGAPCLYSKGCSAICATCIGGSFEQ